MARKPLSGDVYKITETIDKTYEGEYMGARRTDTGHKNPDGSPKLSTIHTINLDGAPWSFWGFTAIDNILSRVGEGTYLWITYKGKVKTKNGQAHTVAVDFDDETGQPMPTQGVPRDSDPTSDAPPWDPDDMVPA
jgi:hypothetical protein